jgi:hypothetical protein
MCATPCWCMKSTASNSCLATDHRCSLGFVSSIWRCRHGQVRFILQRWYDL